MKNAQLVAALSNKRNNSCCYCQLPMTSIELGILPSTRTKEHKTPKAQNGHNGLCNLDVACNRCNGFRGTANSDLYTAIVKRLFQDPDIVEAWHCNEHIVEKLLRKLVRLQILYAYAFINAQRAYEYLEEIKKHQTV
jgi:hypothetical protein